MSLFDWLLVGHLVGDFVLQTDSMAYNKARDWSWMLRHVACYMIPVTAVVAAYVWISGKPVWLAVLALLVVAGTHLILDRRKAVEAWMGLIGIPGDHPWLPIVLDQVFHILILAVVSQILVLVRG